MFLLGVVVLTGVYVTLFFEYGFDASYDAVADMNGHPIQRFMRGLHRYSSAALVLTTCVHAWRIFVAGRFSGPRRWRWVSGVSALALVWIAGLTGYWLVWDVRAQALSEALAGLIGQFGWGASFVVNHLVGNGAGSGAGLMVVVWTLHLGVTAVIGFALYRHLRRSRLHWLPPRPWMLMMGTALVLVTLALPVELLDAADNTALLPDMNLDPFVLMLLPPLLSDYAWWVAGGAVLALSVGSVVPWLLGATRTPQAVVDNEACTGCQLCAIDCPYLAVEMVSSPHAADAPAMGDASQLIAKVDPQACVGCGICLGSCSFGALALAGFEPSEVLDVAGRSVVVACERHARQRGAEASGVQLVEVACTGMFHPQAVGDLLARGAEGVQVIGCAPGECTYGVGNELTHQRLAGERNPHVARRFAGQAKQDYVALGEMASAIGQPGQHTSTDLNDVGGGRRGRIGAAAVVVASVVAVGAATLLPYRGEEGAEVRVVVDHRPGNTIIGQTAPSGSAGDAATVVVALGDEVVATKAVPTFRGVGVGVVDVALEPGSVDLRVELHEGSSVVPLYDGPATLSEGQRFLLEARDVPPPPGVKEGKRVFEEPRLGGCTVCHSTSVGKDGVGPSLAGVATRAGQTVQGLSDRQYLMQSLLDPDAYIVPGYRAGQMLPTYEDRLSADELASLVEYLLTLEDA